MTTVKHPVTPGQKKLRFVNSAGRLQCWVLLWLNCLKMAVLGHQTIEDYLAGGWLYSHSCEYVSWSAKCPTWFDIRNPDQCLKSPSHSLVCRHGVRHCHPLALLEACQLLLQLLDFAGCQFGHERLCIFWFLLMIWAADIKGYRPEWCISGMIYSRYTILVGNPLLVPTIP